MITAIFSPLVLLWAAGAFANDNAFTPNQNQIQQATENAIQSIQAGLPLAEDVPNQVNIRIAVWRKLVLEEKQNLAAARNSGSPEKLAQTELEIVKKVNAVINDKQTSPTGILQWFSDCLQFGVEDRYQGILETITRRDADCEDLSIAKYAALLEIGINRDALRLVITKYLGSLPGVPPQWHMVVFYYPDGKKSAWILDNIDAELKPKAERTDLLLDDGSTLALDGLPLLQVKSLAKALPQDPNNYQLNFKTQAIPVRYKGKPTCKP